MTWPVTMLQFLSLATAITAICMFLSALLLAAYRTGRLRRFNIVVVFAISALAAVYYLEYGARLFRSDWKAGAWGLLAICAAFGLLGMVRIARTERPVWERRKRER